MKIRMATKDEEMTAKYRPKNWGRPRRFDFSQLYVGSCVEFEKDEVQSGTQSLRYYAAHHGWMVLMVRPDCWVRLK